jgi:hypothetical protein
VHSEILGIKSIQTCHLPSASDAKKSATAEQSTLGGTHEAFDVLTPIKTDMASENPTLREDASAPGSVKMLTWGLVGL